MTDKLYIAAERVAGDDEFEKHLIIAKERELGLELQEFYLPDLMYGDWRPRLTKYQQLLQDFQGGLAIHNAYYSIDHLGLDPEVLKLTRQRYDYIFMIAKELDCRIIVSHFNWSPFAEGVYLSRWQEAEIRFWEPYVEQAERDGFLLVGENTSEPRPELLKAIVSKMNSPRFKLNLDVAHVNLRSEVSLEEWIAVYGEDLVYMHVNNNYGDYDSHSAIHQGTIDYDHLFRLLNDMGLAPIIATEIYGPGLSGSIDYLEERIGKTPTYQE